VVTLEPTAALQTCENALRQLMAHAYKKSYGDDWLQRITTEDQRNEWLERAEAEGNTRRGVAVVPPVGLAYANFYELLEFVEEHWEPLAAALGKKASIVALLKRFDNLRNTVAHNRELVTFEKELYSGIAGQIRKDVSFESD
jgi:Swt1-like HEPN